MNSINKYTEYAHAVISGEIVACRYVIQACQRYLNWFNRDDIEFRPEKVDKVVNFISNLKHFTGKFKNTPFILADWQFFVVCNIFGWYYKNTDTRVTNLAYVEVSRKNGKSAILAAIQLYMMIADGESGAEVDCLANNRQQAKILFDMCSNFLQSIDPKGKYFKRYRDSIKFDKTKSFVQVLSSEASGLDGFNAYSFCLDEVHEYPDSKLYDVMRSSQGMRTNPLGFLITTAGFNKNGFCYQFRQTCTEILQGVKDNDNLFSMIFTLDEEDNWEDENVWKKACPNLDVTVQRSYLKQQVQEAKNNASLLVGVLTKNFNVWCDSAITWIPSEYIMKSSHKINREKYKDRECYIGVDLAAVSDLTAVSYMFPPNEKEDFYTFFTDYYLPETALTESINAENYKLWKRQKFLKITPGNVTDYDYILNDIMKYNEKFIINSIAYDKWQSVKWVVDATAQGLPMLEFSQALGNFNRPTREFERLCRSNKVVMENNPITRFCFENVAIKTDWNENAKPIKGGNVNQKIDGVIAMLQALGRYLETPQYDNII